jgi:hypothetical protein
MRGRKSNRAGADNRNSKIDLGLRTAAIDIDGVTRLRTVSFGEKSFKRSYRNRLVDFSATACSLAWMSAHASANAGHRIGLARSEIGSFEVAFRNLGNIAARIGVRGAGHHAGKIGVQPIPVNLLVDEPLLHESPSLLSDKLGGKKKSLPAPLGYLLSVKSAAVSPATLTGFDLFFAPSCHAVTVYAPSGTFSILNSPAAFVSAKYGVGETIT